jgi:hypothetical protein
MAAMDSGLLTDRYQFPVRDPRQVRTVCDSTLPLLPGDQAALHEDLSRVQGGPRFERIERRIRDASGAHYARELVTGHSGSGKSTELLRLVSQLRIPKGGVAFHVVYVDADEYLSPWSLRLPQIIVAIVAALVREPRLDLKNTRSATPLLGRLRKIAGVLGEEVAKKIDNLAGLPLFATMLKVSSELSSQFRDEALRQRQELVDLTRELIAEVRIQLPAEVADLVFVIDNLEKIPEQALPGGESLHDVLFVHDLPSLDLPAHMVLTYPISMNYTSSELGRAFPGGIRTTLPMVSIRTQPDDGPQRDLQAGLDALTRLVGRRIDLGLFADIEVVEHAARLSGGCVKDLLRLIGELPIVGKGEVPFTRDMIDTVANELRNDYTRLLQGKAYVKLLPAIARTGEIPDDIDPSWKREILLGLIVLEYDGDTWFDVHPLVKRNRRYKRVAAAKESG